MVFSAGGIGVFFWNSCSTMPTAVVAPLEIPGAHYVGNHACFECHTNIVRQFSSQPARPSQRGKRRAEGRHRLRILPWSGQQARRSRRWHRQIHHQPGPDPGRLFPLPPGDARGISTARASSRHRRPHELCPMPRSARRRHLQTGGRPGHGAAQRNLRPMPPRADAAICLRAPRPARRLRDLPQFTRLNQPHDAQPGR